MSDTLMLEAEYKDYECSLGFVITKSKPGTYHGVLFLVDRQRFSKKWWTTKLSEAMSWVSEYAANKAASKLKYGDVEVRGRTDFHK